MNLSERDKEILKYCIDNNKPIPSQYRNKLFKIDDVDYVEATKDYKLIYKGKARKEDIIANTPSSPLQKIRSFNSDNPFKDGWQNMLIFGDNLFALKAIYEDQRGKNIYKTKNKIKLIYIDPPFATKQDFMKDREKAYRDKIIGAQFIEFLRKRLILLREVLSDDGSIYVHLDLKKGHYIKSIMDEVFLEHNFLGELVWKKLTNPKKQSSFFGNVHDTIFAYTKGFSDFKYSPIFLGFDQKYIKSTYRFLEEKTGRIYGSFDLTQTGQGPSRNFGKYGDLDPPQGKHWIWSQKKIDKALEENRILFSSKGWPRVKKYLDEQKGKVVSDLWDDLPSIQAHAKEDSGYPTQKPEILLERIISASSDENDIVLDAFAGSGTALSVSEKLKRRWIGMDCGKLSIYILQKRMLNLTTHIGSTRKDERRDYERVDDFADHSKTSRGLFFIFEKARKGDFVVTDAFLKSLAKFIEEDLSGNTKQEFSLICPKEKFKVEKLKVVENEEGKAGEKIISVGRVNFLVSFIQPKEKTEKEKSLKAKEFSLYNAGIYDQQLIYDMDWEKYHPFVAQLFEVRLEKHKIYGFYVDGYLGVYPAYIWPYPIYKDQILDKEYVRGLHKTLGGRAGEKFYIIAPVTAMGFMEDEIPIGKTSYNFLKVPLSILMALIEKGEPGSLKQPMSESDVNEVIDAVGFDFISQPIVKAYYRRLKPLDKTLLNQNKKDYVIEVKDFKSNTLAYDPEDFKSFETLSMVLVDCNYNDDYFNLSNLFWSDETLDDDKKGAIVRIPQDDFIGKKMMIIFMDRYGNELKVVKTKREFK